MPVERQEKYTTYLHICKFSDDDSQMHSFLLVILHDDAADSASASVYVDKNGRVVRTIFILEERGDAIVNCFVNHTSYLN